MSRKRRNSSSPECEELSSKRRSTPALTYDDEKYEADSKRNNERPHIDSSTGQSGAFPGLGDDRELFYGPAADGIDYIRMVRSEAKGIPYLLTSQLDSYQQQDESQDVEEEDGGYYFDGAYTARPNMLEQKENGIGSAQTLYYDSLLTQFNLVRATMKCVPPLPDVEKLSSSQPISFPAASSPARKVWEDQLANYDPHPVQVACMDGNSALQLLNLIQRRIFMLFKTRDLIIVKRLGAWTWAVLGKAPDRGLLSSEEIGNLRHLAKRAKAVMDKLDAQFDEADSDIPDSDNDIDEETHDLEGDIGNARLRLEAELLEEKVGTGGGSETETISQPLNQLNRSTEEDTEISDRQHSLRLQQEKKIVLDMIISIIGEVYGQRDLLELRTPWVEQTA